MPDDSPQPDASPGPASAPGYRRAPAWAALIATGFTWPLLFVGGLVTTYRVGLAVPDWPTTFGINMFLFDMREAAWGVFIEHGHRLYGAAVGLAVIVLMVDFLLFDRRRWIKGLGVAALLLVIGQGVLGGLRVNRVSTALAMVHGCTGQAFFAFMAVLATLTARSWFVRRVEPRAASGLKAVAIVAAGAAYLQIVAGAWLRHFGGLAALGLHAGSALGVVGLAVGLGVMIGRRRGEVPGLVGPVAAAGLVLVAQLTLGVAAWWMLRPFDGLPHEVTTAQALIRTGHQANAALLLAALSVLAVKAVGGAAGVPIASEGRAADGANARGRVLEVVS